MEDVSACILMPAFCLLQSGFYILCIDLLNRRATLPMSCSN